MFICLNHLNHLKVLKAKNKDLVIPIIKMVILGMIEINGVLMDVTDIMDNLKDVVDNINKVNNNCGWDKDLIKMV